ncbi:Monocarboxylate transporter 14, partial [Acromyrmex echinatior]
VWAGALSAAISRGSAPLVVGACRRGNTRLTAVIGGLVLALASLFTSFAVQMHQVLLSYGLVLGTGAGLVRETASLVLGNYFRKRREFVEMVVQAGTGVGIVLFSVVYKEAVGKLGWRPGLQSVTGALSLAFFLGLIYRSASLYHPQRRAILHLKNQRSKVKEKKSSTKIPRQPLVDLSPLGSRPVRMLMLAAGAAGFGLYTPAFYIALQGYQDGLEASALVLLQTFLGLAAALGCAALGVVIVRPSAQCLVSRQYLCQAALIGVAVAQVALGSVQGYHGLVLASALYGASLGGTLYSLKMLALERLRARHFARSWALVQAAEALPILLGVPLTGYMNASSPRVGYYACTLSSLCGAALLFLVGWGRQPASPVLPGPRLSSLGIVPPPPPCAPRPPPPDRRPLLPSAVSYASETQQKRARGPRPSGPVSDPAATSP